MVTDTDVGSGRSIPIRQVRMNNWPYNPYVNLSDFLSLGMQTQGCWLTEAG